MQSEILEVKGANVEARWDNHGHGGMVQVTVIGVVENDAGAPFVICDQLPSSNPAECGQARLETSVILSSLDTDMYSVKSVSHSQGRRLFSGL